MSRDRENGQGDLGDDPVSDDELEGYVARSRDVGDLESLSALSSFVRQMTQYPRLSPAEQMTMITDCRAGAAARQRLEERRGSPESDRRDREIVRHADRSMTQLLGSTIRLVILIVRENADRRLGQQRALAAAPDLVAECMVALTKAVYDFDPDRVPSFSAYAARVARDTVRMSLGNDSLVRVPTSWARIRRIAAVRIPNLTVELARPPTPAEVHEVMFEACLEWAAEHLTPAEQKLPAAARLEAMTAKLRKQGMLGALDHLDDVLNTARPVSSLDQAVGDTPGATLGDLVAAPADQAMFDHVEQDELRVVIEQALAPLPPRERDIVILRFDLNRTGEVWTYKRIAEQYGITAERIRQIEHNALSKMRLPRDGGLSSFLGSDPDE